MASRLRRLRPLAPPAALFAGLFLFGVSLLVLGTAATEEGTRELDASGLTVTNGTALLTYRAHDYFGERTERIDVTYAFPQAAGDAYFVGCDDLARLAQGQPPSNAMLAFMNLREGAFVASHQTVTTRDQFFTRAAVESDDGESNRTYRRYCDPAIAFQWQAPDGDPAANLPTVTVQHHSAQLDGESFALLAMLMGGSALLALLGGLAWARARAPRERDIPSDDSTVEALRSSLESMGEQLERTRKHLLLAGVLGVFVWYPFLVPWAWIQASRSSDEPLVPWAVGALTLAFLVVLTILWAREFLRLDRELNAWRGRLWELRDREEHLMDTLEQGG